MKLKTTKTRKIIVAPLELLERLTEKITDHYFFKWEEDLTNHHYKQKFDKWAKIEDKLYSIKWSFLYKKYV